MSSEIRVRAGTREITARRDSVSSGGEGLPLAPGLGEALFLPEGLLYQFAVGQGTVHVGPVIGILASDGHVSRRDLSSLSAYTLLYHFFNGVLCVFGAGDLDVEKGLVRAFYFTGDKQSPWKESLLPVPDTVYRRARASRDVVRYLTAVTGGRMFNSRFFDKWQFWELTSADPALRNHIPCTRRLESPVGVDTLLGASGATYIKPAYGTMAYGVYKVVKEACWYWVMPADPDKSFEVMDKDRLVSFVESLVKSRAYLMQEPVDTLRYEGRMVDFRVIMQKDETCRWSVTGIVAKCGAAGGISSNFVDQGFALPFDECMSRLFKLSESQAFARHREITGACTYLCQTLDRTGENYGDLGVDVALDHAGKVWLLEINKRHDHHLPKYINDLQFYYAVKSNPIKYGVALAGFRLSPPPIGTLS